MVSLFFSAHLPLVTSCHRTQCTHTARILCKHFFTLKRGNEEKAAPPKWRTHHRTVGRREQPAPTKAAPLLKRKAGRSARQPRCRERQHHAKKAAWLSHPCGLELFSPSPLPPCGRCCCPLFHGWCCFLLLPFWVVVLSSFFPFGWRCLSLRSCARCCVPPCSISDF